jgi:hypothetical protein
MVTVKMKFFEKGKVVDIFEADSIPEEKNDFLKVIDRFDAHNLPHRKNWDKIEFEIIKK